MDKTIKNKFLSILKRLLVLLLIYALSRILFYIYNYQYLEFIPVDIRRQSFYFGLITDISTIIYTNFLFVILWLAPFRFASSIQFNSAIKWIYIVWNSLLQLLNLIDTGLYRFSGYRSSFSALHSYSRVLNENPGFIQKYIFDYWYLVIWFILIMIILTKFYFHETNVIRLKKRKYVLMFAGIFILLIIGARGLNDKPLSVKTVARKFQFEFNALVLNTPFVIIDQWLFENKRIHQLKETNLEKKYSDGNYEVLNNQNVVILIVEGLSREFIGILNENKGYAPYIDSLIRKGFICKYAFANGRTTLNALPAILCSKPVLSDFPIVFESFTENKTESIATILEASGYSTNFFYGSKNGNLGIEKFVGNIDFNHYYGMDQYPNKKDFDGYWGIYDDKFLDFSVQIMDTINEPFLSCILTLSSHHPYQLPEYFNIQSNSGQTKHQMSVLYSDYSIRKFFEKAKKSLWYKNTLFVITADHASEVSSSEYQSLLGQYAIPIIFYHPSDTSLRGETNQIVTQIDINSGILDYLQNRNNLFQIKESLFNKKRNGNFFFYSNQYFYLFQNSYLMRYVDDSTFDCAKTIGNQLYQTDNFHYFNDDQVLEMKSKIKVLIDQ